MQVDEEVFQSCASVLGIFSICGSPQLQNDALNPTKASRTKDLLNQACFRSTVFERFAFLKPLHKSEFSLYLNNENVVLLHNHDRYNVC